MTNPKHQIAFLGPREDHAMISDSKPIEPREGARERFTAMSPGSERLLDSSRYPDGNGRIEPAEISLD